MKQILEQALDALKETAMYGFPTLLAGAKGTAAIAAIESALAAQKVSPEKCHCYDAGVIGALCEDCPTRAAPAQAPYGYVAPRREGQYSGALSETMYRTQLAGWEPVYKHCTAPAQEPLSMQELTNRLTQATMSGHATGLAEGLAMAADCVAPAQEPVGYARANMGTGGGPYIEWRIKPRIGDKFYTSPPPVQAQELVNPWREAVLDQVAIHCIDCPTDTPPADVLKRVIYVATMATGPVLNEPVATVRYNEHQILCIFWNANHFSHILKDGDKLYTAAPTIPAGMVMVPEEPTKKIMEIILGHGLENSIDTPRYATKATALYKAMIQAAKDSK